MMDEDEMRERFGEDESGVAIERVTLRRHGLEARVIGWGAVLQDLRLDGVAHSLVLGFERFEDYPRLSPDFGAVVGPVANRIRGARAAIAGVERRFDRNCLGRHTLHGGARGTGRIPWRIDAASEEEARLSLTLADGHIGFPGPLALTVVYRIEPGPALVFEAEATTGAATVCNLAHHSYFALDGPGADCRTQILSVNAEAYLPVDEDLCPTGEVRSVAGGPFDLRNPRAIGDHGFDHNMILGDARGPCRPAAKLRGPASGLEMTIETTEPGLQLYDGVSIPRTDAIGLGGAAYGPHAGVALEPQAWPDAPNQRWAAQVGLAPGEPYRQRSVFRFS